MTTKVDEIAPRICRLSTLIVGPRWRAEDAFGQTCLAPSTPKTIRQLADLAPRTLAVMHGSSFTGDCAGMLHALADDYRDRITAAA